MGTLLKFFLTVLLFSLSIVIVAQATMLLPIAVAFVLVLSWLFNIFWDKCVQNRKVSSSAAKIMVSCFVFSSCGGCCSHFLLYYTILHCITLHYTGG